MVYTFFRWIHMNFGFFKIFWDFKAGRGWFIQCNGILRHAQIEKIGHFHLSELKFWEIAQKSKKGIIGALFQVCNISTSSVQGEEKKQNFNEMGLKKYSLAGSSYTGRTKVDIKYRPHLNTVEVDSKIHVSSEWCFKQDF